MMAARRWLTAQYDWTGLSRRLYLSEQWEIGMLAVVALVVLALFMVPGMLGIPFGSSRPTGPRSSTCDSTCSPPRRWYTTVIWSLPRGLALLLGINACADGPISSCAASRS